MEGRMLGSSRSCAIGAALAGVKDLRIESTDPKYSLDTPDSRLHAYAA